MKNILTLTFFAFCFLGNAQLTDPFGKIVTHEIKLNKLKNGSYIGAIEWTTGGIDSLQRYVVNGLDINAPVMVRIISKAPDHNIDLSFHKTGWDNQEFKISTSGEKFADKIFRTMGTAGIGVSSEVAGIPYLIMVKVGLQFPSTIPLIRITEDKKEYAQHMRRMGYMGALFSGDDNSSMSNNSSASTSSSGDNNTLMYVIIGLLAVIAILMAVFLLKRKNSRTTALLFITFCSTQFCLAQSSQPKLVPLDGQGESPVFYDYMSSNVANQNTVPVTTVMNSREVDIDVQAEPGDVFLESRPMRIESNPGSIELTGPEAEEAQRRMREAREEFEREYEENMPGEETEGDQRTLPVDRTEEELEQLRRQVRQLQRDVERLSKRDEEFERELSDDAKILIYCESRVECFVCLNTAFQRFLNRYEYYTFLQNYYGDRKQTLDGWVKYGDALASVPNAGLGWGSIRQHRVVPAMQELTKAYDSKFDQYMDAMESDLKEMEECHKDGEVRMEGGFTMQAKMMINSLKISKIQN